MFKTMFVKRPRIPFARLLSRATATVALPWYGVLLVLVIGMSAAAVGRTGQRQPNILYIMADDHTSPAWGCYGGRLKDLCPTTNIDRLARAGARLTNCFCTNSICVPSRAAILTGQYSHINGVRTLAGALAPTADNVAKHLQQAGYQTALVGKWHLKKPPAGFDYWNIIKGQGRYREPIMYEMDLHKPVVQKGRYCTDVFTDTALDWLGRRAQDKPFCLLLHFKATHEPWQFDARFADMFSGVEIPAPATLLGTVGPIGTRVAGWPLEILTQRMSENASHGGSRLRLDTQDPLQVRRATYQKFLKDYLRCVAGIDENMGRILAYLDQHGLSQDTVVIYTSDQGYFLGEHDYFDKRFMLEESLRMPFIVRYPREIKPNSVISDIILNVDFAETMLDYAGATPPASMQGRSFRANLNGHTQSDWRDAMYYRYYGGQPTRPAHFGIRTLRDKLIYYDGLKDNPPGDRWEYYDLVADPHETRNQYDAPQFASRISTLKQRLTTLQRKLGDQP